MRRTRVLGVVAAAFGCLWFTPGAVAAPTARLTSIRAVGNDVTRLHYRYGPLLAAPGHNLILLGPVTIERPPGDGYVVRVKPDLTRPDGTVPPVEQVHMHHAVFLNLSRRDATDPGLPERFYAFGEEKTIAALPYGYGYPVRGGDVWAVNYMLHNGTTRPEVLFVDYTVDWIPARSARGLATKPARPIWMDVQNGKAYPVFDVHRGTGGRDRRFTYPDEARGPYGRGRRLNEWTVDRDGVLLMTAGHVHPGGLWTDLDVIRGGRRKLVYHSQAKYFDPNGPVSWDMAMTRTLPDWRVGIRKGDKLRISTTYETKRASWYESMGIMIAYMASGSGPNPFTSPIQTRGEPTHGHLPETSNHGGEDIGGTDPAGLPDGQTIDDRVGVMAFEYFPGDFGLSGSLKLPPVIDPGQSLRFDNVDSPLQIFHTITACRAPCNRSTGVSYPLANGPEQFDSGQLGYGPRGFTAAVNRSDWSTPRSLPPGTYTYFCRVHPFMRGSFRVRGSVRRAGCSARVSISRRAVRLRGGALRVRVRCGRGGGRCLGTLTLRRGRTRVGARLFDIAAGRARAVRVRLTRRGRRLVTRLGSARLRATAVPGRGACRFGVARARLTAKAAHRAGHRR